MEEEFKKALTNLWERGGVKFNHFEFVTQEQCNKIIEETPKKYEKNNWKHTSTGSSIY